MDSNQDDDHLRMLSIFHFVLAGILAVGSLFPIIHLVIGLAMISGAIPDLEKGGPGGPPLALVGWMFVLIPATMMIVGFCCAVGVAIAGRKISRRRGYLYCLVVAGIECCFMPLGTALGVCTLIVLMRPSVKEKFGVV